MRTPARYKLDVVERGCLAMAAGSETELGVLGDQKFVDCLPQHFLNGDRDIMFLEHMAENVIALPPPTGTQSTTVEGTIQYLFEGRITNYIECTNVEYKSTRTEVFQDLQLDVKGCKNVYESFDKYVEVEHLNGDNQYRAEGHGLQDAQKGVLFEGFPPVLELQLKRFEYDFQQDMMVKVSEDVR